jgi:hypothetical protein
MCWQVAPIYIIANAGIALLMVWLPYAVIVEFAMLLNSITSFAMLYSFLFFKASQRRSCREGREVEVRVGKGMTCGGRQVRKPSMERPFKIPGGTLGALVLCSTPAMATAANMYFALTDEQDGRPPRAARGWRGKGMG